MNKTVCPYIWRCTWVPKRNRPKLQIPLESLELKETGTSSQVLLQGQARPRSGDQPAESNADPEQPLTYFVQHGHLAETVA